MTPERYPRPVLQLTETKEAGAQQPTIGLKREASYALELATALLPNESVKRGSPVDGRSMASSDRSQAHAFDWTALSGHCL